MDKINLSLARSMISQKCEWTSLQININTTSDPHEDSNNIGPSCILLAGTFTGGEFNYLDRYETSKTGYWFPFHGTETHSSNPFEAYRVSIVAFQHSKAAMLPEGARAPLKKLGFRSSLLTSAQPSGAPAIGDQHLDS